MSELRGTKRQKVEENGLELDDYSWCSRIHLDTLDNFPFFTKNTPIDFPFIENKLNSEIQSSKTTSDISEFIDLKSLVIPRCFDSSDTGSSSERTRVDEGSDKDVDSSREDLQSKSALELEERPAPRRNPPRKAHLKKPVSGGSVQRGRDPLAKRGGAQETATPKTRCRRRKQRKDRKQYEMEERREFGTLAHHNLHSIMTYVNNMKTVNAFLDRPPQCNVAEATALLQNACLLYCIANDVEPDMLAGYLSDIATGEQEGDVAKPNLP